MQSIKAPPTSHSLLALATGLILGIACQGVENPVVVAFASIVEPLGGLWASALIMIALPLVAANLLRTLINRDGPKGMGSLVAIAFPLFIALLCVGSLFAALLVPLFLETVSVDPASLSSLSIAIPAAAQEVADGVAERSSFTAWLVGLVPTNPIRAAADGNVLQVLIVAIFFGLAANALPDKSKQPIAEFIGAVSDTIFVMLGWVLKFIPLGVFALAYVTGRGMGVGAAGLLVQFVLIVSGMLVLHTIVLYPLTAVLGGISLARFSRAVGSGQLVGLSTRSSLAALPVLIDSAKKKLSLQPGVGEFALPLAASTFKSHRTVSSTTEMLFLAHVYGIDLTFTQVLGFVITVIILSFSAVGVPGGRGGFSELPAYLALGIPVEGYLVLEAVEVIPDIFKTVNNVTGYMSVTVMLDRLKRRK